MSLPPAPAQAPAPTKRTRTSGGGGGGGGIGIGGGGGGGIGNEGLLHMVTHPVILSKLTQMRRAETSSKHFRELLSEITLFLGFAATQDLAVESIVVQAATGGTCSGVGLKSRIAIVPIMRSGLGMVDSMLTVTPHATVYHLGMYSNPESLMPVLYFNKLPAACNTNAVVVLEPQIGTGSSLIATLDLVKEWAAGKTVNIKVLSIVASRPGLERVREAHPDVTYHLVAIDDGLEGALPVPGIGDVGARVFNS